MQKKVKHNEPEEVKRLSDQVQEGIYFFGGRSASGKTMSTKLRYLKLNCIDNKVNTADWVKIKQTGTPPCGRTGHVMTWLPVNHGLLIAGGRNDEECKMMNTPFLNDIHIFLLD